MQSISDDELYAVQGRYLGPPGKELPFAARYSAYGVFAGYALAALIVRAQLRILPGAMGYVLLVLGAVLATVYTMRLVTPERPVTAVLAGFWDDIDAPRPDTGTVYRGAPELRRVAICTDLGAASRRGGRR